MPPPVETRDDDLLSRGQPQPLDIVPSRGPFRYSSLIFLFSLVAVTFGVILSLVVEGGRRVLKGELFRSLWESCWRCYRTLWNQEIMENPTRRRPHSVNLPLCPEQFLRSEQERKSEGNVAVTSVRQGLELDFSRSQLKGEISFAEASCFGAPGSGLLAGGFDAKIAGTEICCSFLHPTTVEDEGWKWELTLSDSEKEELSYSDKEEEHVDVDSAVADSAVPEPETERKADTPDLIKTDNAKCRLFEEVEPVNDEDELKSRRQLTAKKHKESFMKVINYIFHLQQQRRVETNIGASSSMRVVSRQMMLPMPANWNYYKNASAFFYYFLRRRAHSSRKYSCVDPQGQPVQKKEGEGDVFDRFLDSVVLREGPLKFPERSEEFLLGKKVTGGSQDWIILQCFF